MQQVNSDLAQCVRTSLEKYFTDLDGEVPHAVYSMVLNLVEKSMLEVVLQQTEHNQSKAAQWLGINRNTLRKKMQQHNLIE